MSVAEPSVSAPTREPWLAPTPAGWHETRLRYLVGQLSAGDWGSEPAGSGDVYVVRAADFDREHLAVDRGKLPMRHIAAKKLRALRLRRGDLLLEKSGGGDEAPVGIAVLFDHDIPAVPSNFAARVRAAAGVHPGFLRYVFAALYYMRLNERSIKQTTGIQNIDVWSFLDERCLAPDSYQTQQSIALRLDRGTEEIDKLVAAKSRMRSLLEERIQADVDAAFRQVSGHKRLWHIAAVRPSNVDKLTVVGEPEVQLCNYMHAYKNLEISADMDFMPATATSDQIKTFELRPGDILVTKDSETSEDIGVAALVRDLLPPRTLCGYHLALIRPRSDAVVPEYLHWALRSGFVRSQLVSAANGVTRFGVRADDLRGVRIPVPDVTQQARIARRLTADARRTVAVSDQLTRQIQLLAEGRRALITEAVTGASARA